MLTTAAAGVVTHDLLVRRDTQTRLQIDANRVAIAGAVFLPDAPARATLAATHSAALCGLSRLEVVHADAASDRMSFDVTLHRTAPLLVLWLLGLSGVSVTATATVYSSARQRQANASIVLSRLGAPARFNSRNAASSKAASRRTAVL